MFTWVLLGNSVCCLPCTAATPAAAARTPEAPSPMLPAGRRTPVPSPASARQKGKEAVASPAGSSLGPASGDPWTVKYAPHSTSEIIANQSMVRRAASWQHKHVLPSALKILAPWLAEVVLLMSFASLPLSFCWHSVTRDYAWGKSLLSQLGIDE